VAKTIADPGGLHILVNNAGLELPEPLIDTTNEEYDRMMATNLKSMVLFSKAAGVHLIAGGSAASST
jgi:NAD(P)-dependent dehydrogenase (short-subunit alcohol dehydrogenase family)